MNAINEQIGQDEGVARRRATLRDNMERDEEFDEDEEEDSGYTTLEESDGGLNTAEETEEESVAESVVADRLHDDEMMWRELDEAFQLKEQEERMDEASSGRNSPLWDQQGEFQLVNPEEFLLERRSGQSSPTEYAPWDQEELPDPTAQAWEPARPPILFHMVDNMSEANESEDEAVAEAGAADGEASQTLGNDIDVAMCDPRWQHMWVCQKVAELREQALREERARQQAVQLAQARQRLAAIMESKRQNQQQQQEIQQQQLQQQRQQQNQQQQQQLQLQQHQEIQRQQLQQQQQQQETQQQQLQQLQQQQQQDQDQQVEYRECPWVWPRPIIHRQMSAPTGPREEARPAVARQVSCPVPNGHERYEAVQPEEWSEAVEEITLNLSKFLSTIITRTAKSLAASHTSGSVIIILVRLLAVTISPITFCSRHRSTSKRGQC
ncbi:uncharacterized protein [Drosophila tropicalis]|uniref:uncharacterized protein n=1 Tax=Drosophila tropicalis TaxID=46794 RepID=UPI0035AB7060